MEQVFPLFKSILAIFHYLHFCFCIFATLVFSDYFHLWVCLLVWFLSSFFVFLSSFFPFLFFSWVWVLSFFVCSYLISVAFFHHLSWGFVCLFVCMLVWFPISFPLFLFCTAYGILVLQQGVKLEHPSPGCWTTREVLAPWNSNQQVLSQRPPFQH